MQSVNLRQLRDTKQLKAWLAAGETVELRERNRVLGRILPQKSTTEQLEKRKQMEWPDFAARRKAIFGDRILTPVADLIAARDEERY